MKKKSISTGRVARLRRYERWLFLLPIFPFLLSVLTEEQRSVLSEMVAANAYPQHIAAALYLILLHSLPFSIVVFLIVYSALRGIRKYAQKEASFQGVWDIDYYRDKLSGLSPAAISMLTDLSIEPRKDIAALILKYTMMGVVSNEEGRLHVENQGHPDLRPSDHVLLRALAGQAPLLSVVGKWARFAEQEVVGDGYLTKAKKAKPPVFTGYILPFAVALLVFSALTYVVSSSGMAGAFLDAGAAWGGNGLSFAQRVEALTASTGMAPFLAILMVKQTALLCLFITPVMSGYRMRAWKSSRERVWTRTDTGALITEQIYGMRNFLRDFSALSEVEKEQLVLWDDFLIYAVILEENEQIVKELCSIRGFRTQQIEIL